ncbi:MAG: elongation factor P [Chloroflexi bacterium]|nr:elongation factor P [Chloroflexota bacterium]
MEIEDVRKGTKFLINAIPYRVEDAEFVKPGKGQALYKLKLRNLFDSSVVNKTYRSGDKVEDVRTETYKGQFLYKEGNHYVIMDSATFEQHYIDEEAMGDKRHFLKEGDEVTVTMFGERPLEIEIPTFVELKVVSSAATLKAATVTAQYKPAQLETGATIDVPPFIQEGDMIKVDTRTGTYVERVTGKK